jgi:tetratricopeptide (TPR) repeat protein
MTTLSFEELRRALWDAAAVGDEAALEQLCRTHADAIRQHFAAWRQVPAELRDQPVRIEGYVQTMVAVARLFEQKLGDPSLLRELTGGGGDNPLVRWQQRLDHAQKAMDELRYRETAGVLTDLLIDVRGLKGSGPDAYLPPTFGLLGECYFQSGEVEKAVAPTEQALQICRRTGDVEGVATYLGNLYEIHRYRGASQRAADAAEELAERLGEQGQKAEAEQYTRQAQLVRQGEPLNRVIVNVDGRRRELDEVLAGTPGQVQFAFVRNRVTLRPAEALTKQGEKQAGQGRFEAALGLFEQAAQADHFDPQCHYQAGLTLLYLQRYAEAQREYLTTEELAPGWFHCRSSAWLARQLLQGAVSHETFQCWHVLEEGPLSPAQKSNLVEKALRQAPNLALLHQIHGKCLRAVGLNPAAEKAYRRGLELAEEPDIKTRLLVDLGAMVGDRMEKRVLLQEAVALNGNLLSAAMARVVLEFD